MATLKAALYAALAGESTISTLVSDRIYPGRAPESATFPHLVFSQVSSLPLHHQGGASGAVRARVQIDCFGTTDVSASALADAVVAFLDVKNRQLLSGTFWVNCIGLENRLDNVTGPDDASDVSTYQTTLDFFIWYVS